MSDEMLRHVFREIYSDPDLGGQNCSQTLGAWLDFFFPSYDSRYFAFKGIFDFSSIGYDLAPGSTYTGTTEVRWSQYSYIGGVEGYVLGSTFIEWVGGSAVNRVDDFSQFMMGGPLVILQDDVAITYQVSSWSSDIETITLPMLSVAATIDSAMDFQCVMADAIPACDLSPHVDVEIYQFRDGVSECANFTQFVNIFGIPKGNTK